ncbi:hypothetical protein M3J09_005206 [Ascochyta lentis]
MDLPSLQLAAPPFPFVALVGGFRHMLWLSHHRGYEMRSGDMALLVNTAIQMPHCIRLQHLAAACFRRPHTWRTPTPNVEYAWEDSHCFAAVSEASLSSLFYCIHLRTSFSHL